MKPGSRSIVVAGALGSAAIALLQPAIYIGGPAVYRMLGTPPYIADLRALEPVRMAMWSTFWFALFLTFALYGFSAAGLVRRVPLLRAGLLGIAVIYAVRGFAIVPQLIWLNQSPVTRTRDVAFSGFSILLACSYATAVRRLPRVSVQQTG